MPKKKYRMVKVGERLRSTDEYRIPCYQGQDGWENMGKDHVGRVVRKCSWYNEFHPTPFSFGNYRRIVD